MEQSSACWKPGGLSALPLRLAVALPLERGDHIASAGSWIASLAANRVERRGRARGSSVDEQGRQVVLRDLSSLNGCFVNNVRLKGSGLRRPLTATTSAVRL